MRGFLHKICREKIINENTLVYWKSLNHSFSSFYLLLLVTKRHLRSSWTHIHTSLGTGGVMLGASAPTLLFHLGKRTVAPSASALGLAPVRSIRPLSRNDITGMDPTWRGGARPPPILSASHGLQSCERNSFQSSFCAPTVRKV